VSATITDTLFRLLRPESPPDGSIRAPLDASQPPAEYVGLAETHRERLSPLHRKLLAQFKLPNSANAVARSPYWRKALREPVKAVLARLKAQGLLFEPDNPRARICRGRDESDLRVLCLEAGLLPTGSEDQLADRLLSIDPTGWLLGYTGELLQCSDLDTQRHLAEGRIVRDPSDNEAIWEMLKEQASQTAREGNLALCRNVHLAMANHLLRRKKQAKALQALCIVCVFDLCGVRNRGDAPLEIRRTYSRFDAARASLAPWLVKRVGSLSREMTLTMDEMREAFMHVSTRLGVPKDPRKLWMVLQLALEGTLDPNDEMRRNRVIRNILD
jgi:hypothetical protein